MGGDNESVSPVAPRVRRFGSAGHRTGNGAANHRHAWFAQRDHDRGRQLPPQSATCVRWRDQPQCEKLQAVVAAEHRPAERRAQHLADHDGRSGLRDLRHVWRRHSDTHHGQHRAKGTPIHRVPFDRPLFTLSGGDHYRPQPSLCRLRGHRRTGHWLSGLRRHHRRR